MHRLCLLLKWGDSALLAWGEKTPLCLRRNDVSHGECKHARHYPLTVCGTPKRVLASRTSLIPFGTSGPPFNSVVLYPTAHKVGNKCTQGEPGPT
ncbi:hypothetical protein BX666DRAFT_1940622 [Dichotomocladium elegans]|nr:hypothetical protein BX666DRAFT_1940622 [Dichotomocladium elegans]